MARTPGPVAWVTPDRRRLFFLPDIIDNIFDQGYPLEHACKDLINGAEDKGAMIKIYERLLGVTFRKQR